MKYTLLATIMVLVGASLTLAQTTIPGGNVSGTWDLSGSPYTITGDVTVPGGSDLDIQPGVEVLFSGNIALFVDGTIHAVGTATDSILFTRTQPTGPGWEGIRFWEANSGSEIAYALIEWGNSSGGFYPDNYGGGVFIRLTHNVVIRNSTFRNNVASFGGAIYTAISNVEIHHNVFEDNNAGAYGSAISMLGGGAHLWNNTFVNNEGQVVHFELANENAVMENNIFYDEAIYFETSSDAVVQYNDFYSTSLIGVKPSGLGTITTANINGDPADQYYNIFMDPLFSNVLNGDYHLTAGSPAIDAGNPASPYDPDGTLADLGLFYYNQSATTVTINLTPLNPPITIPATGGSFDFNVALLNHQAMSQPFDVWIMVTLPNGSPYGPVLGPVNLTLPAGGSLDRDRMQAVPAGAPSGIYIYTGYTGRYPNDIWDEDSFPFEKLGTGDGAIIGGWMNSGESLEESSSPDVVPSEFSLMNAFPNPFNPTTVIRYSLQDASRIQLSVFDASGRLIETLVNGWREAGEQEVNFDGSQLASGIYIYRLEAEGKMASGKMLLLK